MTDYCFDVQIRSLITMWVHLLNWEKGRKSALLLAFITLCTYKAKVILEEFCQVSASKLHSYLKNSPDNLRIRKDVMLTTERSRIRPISIWFAFTCFFTHERITSRAIISHFVSGLEIILFQMVIAIKWHIRRRTH